MVQALHGVLLDVRGLAEDLSDVCDVRVLDVCAGLWESGSWWEVM